MPGNFPVDWPCNNFFNTLYKMKKIFLTGFAILSISLTAFSQVLNQLTISPSNPVETDTIYIISDFSYRGDCDFGLIDYWISLQPDSSIILNPLYCGYWDSTQCSRIDTFRLGTYSKGSHPLNIMFHQGSGCPYSDFEAIIYQFDTTIIINAAENVSYPSADSRFPIEIFPNPAKDKITIQSKYFTRKPSCRFVITDLLGQQVFQSNINEEQIQLNVRDWGKEGIYFICFLDQEKNTFDIQKIIVE